MRVIALAALLVGLALATTADAAPSVTRRAATTAIAACLTKAGADKVQRRGAEGGTAYFSRPYNLLGRWLPWSYITQGNKVLGTATAHGKLRLAERRAANRCLKSFNGKVR